MIGGSGDPMAGLRASHAPENSLGNAIHVVKSSVTSALAFAAVGLVGGRAATIAVPRISREMRWMVPMLSASIGAILGAQQGTLQALFDLQPTSSLAVLRRDLHEALELEAQKDAARAGGERTTYVMREQRSVMSSILGWKPASVELIVHSNESLERRLDTPPKGETPAASSSSTDHRHE